MLTNILKNRKCFKLICGAGNEDTLEIEKLIALYATAGANFFDISATSESIEAAKSGIKRSGNNDCHICLSVGLKGDPHIRKARINKDRCIICNKCKQSCPRNIDLTQEVDNKRCIGCGICLNACDNNAIELLDSIKSIPSILSEINTEDISCIELHIQNSNIDEIMYNWEYLNKNFDGILSVCINGSELDKESHLKIITKLLSIRKPYTTIIQADGNSMSGLDNSFSTTQKALDASKLFLNANLPAFIIPSGGTNEQTTYLAKQQNILIDGVAIGSYARKIVVDEISRDDFFVNQAVFDFALKKASQLVKNSLYFLVS